MNGDDPKQSPEVVGDLVPPALVGVLVVWAVPRANLGHATTLLLLMALLLAVGCWSYVRCRRRARATRGGRGDGRGER